MAKLKNKSKKKSRKVKDLKNKSKKFKLPIGKKSLIAALFAPGVYQGVKDLNMSDLKLLDITDEDVRELYSQLATEAGEEYSGLEGKGQLVSDIFGTAFNLSPYSLPFDSDIGFGSKPAGAGSTLDSPSSKKRPVQKTAKLEDLSPSQLRQYRNTLGGFGNITEERRKINELLKGKKKGGKVIKSKTKKNKKSGRPKGVGCATRGYGKAMKRGK